MCVIVSLGYERYLAELDEEHAALASDKGDRWGNVVELAHLSNKYPASGAGLEQLLDELALLDSSDIVHATVGPSHASSASGAAAGVSIVQAAVGRQETLDRAVVSGVPRVQVQCMLFPPVHSPKSYFALTIATACTGADYSRRKGAGVGPGVCRGR